MSLFIMKLFLVQYVVLLLACLWERNWALAMYWTGASIIQLSVLMMKGRL